MDTLTRVDLAEKVSRVLKINQQQADDFVLGFFNLISHSLCDNTVVKLSGFGNFDLHDKAARPGRNPKTGEEAEVSARRVVSFKAGKKLKMIMAD